MSSGEPIALFGGSFNPPHVVHTMVCLYLLETGCQSVWVLPTFQHPLSKTLAPFKDRVEMCRRMLAPLGEQARVCTIEEELGTVSYTIDTVRVLQERHPHQRFQWIVGSDILEELHLWKDADTLKTIVDFRVLYRTGHQNPGAGVAFPELSSTLIRHKLGAGQGVDTVLSRSVLDYISARGLYGSPPGDSRDGDAP